jgi:hypothetical protein
MIILPRQAREKHRENSKTSGVFLQNRTSYIHLMADYYMNGRIREQCRAFTVGFKEVIPDRWLRIFSTPAQLQRLVGGDENAKLDLDDLKKYVNYEGGYHSRHKVIQNASYLSRCHFMVKMIILPRQARDKHRGNSQREGRFLAGNQESLADSGGA